MTARNSRHLDEPSGNAMTCSFSEDGRYIVAGSADSKVRILGHRQG